jgi:hypothetical protein
LFAAVLGDGTRAVEEIGAFVREVSGGSRSEHPRAKEVRGGDGTPMGLE